MERKPLRSRPIYMDHHATTPLHSEVLAAMLPYLQDDFGNASSVTHVYGKNAAEATESARACVAQLVNAAHDDEIIFTSGATESDNLAIKGIAYSHLEKKGHIITSAIEHKAVLESCRRLEREGFTVTYLPVDRYGVVDLDTIKRAITGETILISIQHANGEIGTIQPLDEIGRLAADAGIVFHTDAVQAIGRLAIDVQELKIDLLSISGHKMYGPKGIGALYVRNNVRLGPMFDGGGHEKGYRPGTLNVPGIVGLGKACEIARRDLQQEANRLSMLRDRFMAGVLGRVDLARFNGHPTTRLINNVSFSFEYVHGDALLSSIPEIAMSTGSACSSQSAEPSHVLLALGLPRDLAMCTIRVGLGRCNTEDDVDHAIDQIASNVGMLRSLSPLYEAEAM